MQASDLPNLIGKVIVFNKDIEDSEIDYEPKMKARVISYEDRGDHFGLLTDFSEFEDHNKSLMTANYFDENHSPRLRWCETKFYPKDKKKKDYFDYGTPGFDVEEEKLPEHIQFTAESEDGPLYLSNKMRRPSTSISAWEYSPEDLEAIARHMRAQKKKA